MKNNKEKLYKEIAYAYPSSTNAEKLGFAKTGCFYVQHTFINIENSRQCRTVIAHNSEGFLNRNDPDLIALFNEHEGDIDPNPLAF